MARTAQEVGTLIKTIAGLSMDGFIKLCVVVILVYFASDEIAEKMGLQTPETNHDEAFTMIVERMDEDDSDDMMMQEAFIQATQVQALMEQRIQFEIESLEQQSDDHVNFLHNRGAGP